MPSLLINTVLPKQHTGNHSASRTKLTYRLESEACARYDAAIDRMLQVNNWHEYAGPASANFQLLDSAGLEVNRKAREGDYFQIDVPGPGNKQGGGKDWVQVEKIDAADKGNEQLMYMRVRPAANPFDTNVKTAHFFSPEATSTFLVHRRQGTVTAGVYGRNESPNTRNQSWLDRLRNTVVSIGAFLGLSYTQWKPLVKGWLK